MVPVTDETKYYLWLLLLLGAGSRASVRLVRSAGSAKAVWDDLSDELGQAAKIKPAVLDKLRNNRNLTEAEDIIAWCSQRNVTLITPDMPEYPKSLRCLMDYPMVLFCLGKLPDLNNRFCCAVVGTRDMTEYGKRVAYDIGWGLGDGGAVVVSGLALGVDGMAMAGAESAGGVTVGVLGCGIDRTYPPEHKNLFARVLEKGAIITEYPPGSPPAGNHFPVRNRIISGLSQAVAVIEADMSSGSLITAKHALYQGRSLFAVPGKVGEANAEGCNKLLREGASVVTTANDILSVFEFIYPHSIKLARKPRRSDEKLKLTAAIARVASSADPKSKYQGDGVYGGRGRKKLFSKNKQDPATDAVKPNAPKNPDETKAEAEEKTAKLQYVHLDMLGENERAIYKCMTPNMPMLPDEIGKGKYSISEVLTAMTLLEITGAVEAGAGGYFIRCSEDDDLIDVGSEGSSVSKENE